jgi:hypothetical protein
MCISVILVLSQVEVEVQTHRDFAGCAHGLHDLLLYQVCCASGFTRRGRKPVDAPQPRGDVRL